MPQISAKDLTLGYEGRPIIENLTFSVNSGDYLCIVGENGAGKSTLMRTLLGLQPALAGSIEFGDALEQNQIGYLPQQTLVQRDFPASVFEIVLSGFLGQCGARPFYNKEQRAAAHENIKKMQIEHLEKRCYRELSGGQQQRVLLARALCATRKVLLLDEPVAGLDPKVTAEMYDLIERLNAQDKITVIMISHDLEKALSYASHILHIGPTPFFGTKEQYLQSKTGKAFSAMMGGEL